MVTEATARETMAGGVENCYNSISEVAAPQPAAAFPGDRGQVGASLQQMRREAQLPHLLAVDLDTTAHL